MERMHLPHQIENGTVSLQARGSRCVQLHIIVCRFDADRCISSATDVTVAQESQCGGN